MWHLQVLSTLKFEKGQQMPEDYAKAFKEAVAVFRHARMYVLSISKDLQFIISCCNKVYNISTLWQIWCKLKETQTSQTSYTRAFAATRWGPRFPRPVSLSLFRYFRNIIFVHFYLRGLIFGLTRTNNLREFEICIIRIFKAVFIHLHIFFFEVHELVGVRR